MGQRKIKSVMIFWFLVIGIVPLVIGMLLFFSNQVNTIKNDKANHLLSVRQLKVSKLNNWLTERKGDMHVMAGDYEIRGLENILTERDPGAEAARKMEVAGELLKRNERNYADYETLSILDPESGIVKISTDQELVGMNLSNRDYFTGALDANGLYIQDIHHSEYAAIPVLTMAIPIICLSHNEHVVGILVASINLDQSFYPLLLEREGLGKTGETLIVNSELYAVNELRWYKRAPLNLKIDAEPAVRAANGESGIVVANDYREEKVMAAYTYIPEMNWGFVSKQDISELYIPLYRTIVVFFIILLGAFGLVLVTAFYISRYISNPIEKLTSLAGSVKAGGRPEFNLTEGPKEILLLADMLDHTTRELNSMLDVRQNVYRLSQQVVGEKHMESMSLDLLKEMKSALKCHVLVCYRVDREKDELVHLASLGAEKTLRKPIPMNRIPGDIQAAITEKKIQHTRDNFEEENFRFGTFVGDIQPREFYTVPVLGDQKVMAVICMAHLHRFPEETGKIIEEFWPVLNASFSRQLVSDHLKVTSEALQQAYEKLEVQSEELREQTEELEEQTEELQEMAGELKKQNRELTQKSIEAEESNRLKSEFLSTVSHELRTPLNSIMALSKLLTAKKISTLSEKHRGYLQTIERNGRGLLRLINDILDLSKIEAGKIALKHEEVQVNQVLQYVYDSVLPLAESKKISLVMEPASKLPPVITDRYRLRQIIYNLVQNAIKFTEEGSVKLSAEMTTESILVKVKDTGIGISEKFQPHVFEQFLQADASSTRRYEGTGLGLSIVKKLADLLEIGVNFESRENEGSEFRLRIPLISRYEHMGFDRHILAAEHIEKTSLVGKKLLVVEDNEEAVMQLKAVLEEEQLNVFLAESGEQAMTTIGSFTPDGIILDLMMPGMDGFELLNRIRSEEQTANIPVLVLTAKDLTKEDLDQLNANNVYQLIQKGDINIEEMMEVIRNMLSDSRGEKTVHKRDYRILVADDQIDNRITLRAILDESYDLIDAENAQTAIDLARRHQPSIILMDLNLPGMDGVTATRILKKDMETAHIPVICLTAGESGLSNQQLKDQGFEGLLTKPVDQDEVMEMLEKFLNK